jgi:ribosomal protein L11 methyltransferase
VTWQELRFPLRDLDADRVSDELEALGALAVTLEDGADEPLLEPGPGEQPLWTSSCVRALFEQDADVDAIAATLWRTLDIQAPPHIAVARIEDRRWETVWQHEFQPLRFGRRLWICPSTYAPPDPDAVNVILDPGLAFGTGTHPTTALCLEWLEQADLYGKTVIDFGCGSGILAVAAARLGARRVWAVDHDTQALTATRANAARNGVAERVEAVLPHALAAANASILIANILARPLIELAARFAELIGPADEIVLSGILEPQGDELIDAYACKFSLQSWALREGWLCLAGRRLAQG